MSDLRERFEMAVYTGLMGFGCVPPDAKERLLLAVVAVAQQAVDEKYSAESGYEHVRTAIAACIKEPDKAEYICGLSAWIAVSEMGNFVRAIAAAQGVKS